MAIYTTTLRIKFVSIQSTSFKMRSFFSRCVSFLYTKECGVNLIHTITPDSNGRSYIWSWVSEVEHDTKSDVCTHMQPGITVFILMQTTHPPKTCLPWGSASPREPEPGSLFNICSTRGDHSNSGFRWDTRIQHSSNSCILFLNTKAQVKQSCSLCKMN